MNSLSNQIKQKYELGHVLHMTDYANLESILKDKFIFSKNNMDSNSKKILDISNQSVQDARANITIKETGKNLHDYVPLYWGKKTPMVAALQAGNQSLVFLNFSTNLLAENDCVISDGNARTHETKFKVLKAIEDLGFIDAKSVNTVKYATDPEVRRRKQSELLVLDRLNLKHLLFIVCYSNEVKYKILQLLSANQVDSRVYIGGGNYYF
jgi:hypothetical protein